ncbi:MAG: peptidoglycan DD-metalloendopeptidase family protein [Candidatus Sericytochromatia bacterium]|nr:peptidoglycan DD-metalloendopeptidase family protein [Candidatus Sericytochromatia bacterium]
MPATTTLRSSDSDDLPVLGALRFQDAGNRDVPLNWGGLRRAASRGPVSLLFRGRWRPPAAGVHPALAAGVEVSSGDLPVFRTSTDWRAARDRRRLQDKWTATAVAVVALSSLALVVAKGTDHRSATGSGSSAVKVSDRGPSVAVVPTEAPVQVASVAPGSPGQRTASRLGSDVVPVVGPRKVKVRKGDTAEKIARRFGLKVRSIHLSNGINSGTILQIGRELTIPPVNGFYHVVTRGETLGALLRRHSVERSEFFKYNPDVRKLRQGKAVFVPSLEGTVAPRPRRVTVTHRGLFEDVGRAIGQAFHWPMARRSVSSSFGPRGAHFHPGLDITSPVGTPIRAARDGVVVATGWDGAYGKMVEIDHGGGVHTRYAHASRIHVAQGQTVEAGDVIANVGMTGRTTGPHLHYEVRVNGRPVNPRRFH